MRNEIPAVFHNGSNYDSHFAIRELANELERQFECLGENTNKYKTFFLPIREEIKNIDKDGNKSFVTISCKIKFIDSARLITSSLSNLVDNVAEGTHKIRFKDCDCFLKTESAKDNLIKYKCSSCSKNYSNKTKKAIQEHI